MSTLGTKYTTRPMAKTNNSDSLEKEKPRSIAGSITAFGSDTLQKTGEGFAEIGKGIFEQLLAQSSSEHEQPQKHQEQDQRHAAISPEGGTVFNFRNIEEERQMDEIKQLLKQIKQEIEAIRTRSNSMLASVKDIENTAINSTQQEKGIYFINLLVTFLREIQKISMEVGNSNNWMEAMQTKKAKRGSLFATRSKKGGTQYSQSQELSNARSIQ